MRLLSFAIVPVTTNICLNQAADFNSFEAGQVNKCNCSPLQQSGVGSPRLDGMVQSQGGSGVTEGLGSEEGWVRIWGGSDPTTMAAMTTARMTRAPRH